MTWHYQIIKSIEGDYYIGEVYDDSSWTGAVEPRGETAEELLKDLGNMVTDANIYPILDEEQAMKGEE